MMRRHVSIHIRGDRSRGVISGQGAHRSVHPQRAGGRVQKRVPCSAVNPGGSRAAGPVHGERLTVVQALCFSLAQRALGAQLLWVAGAVHERGGGSAGDGSSHFDHYQNQGT